MSYMSTPEERWAVTINLLRTMSRFDLCRLTWSQDTRYRVHKYDWKNKN